MSKLVSSRVSTLTRFASTSPSLLPSIGTALGLIHKTPEKPWTVPILAAQVGISRSPFAARLTVLVDQSSMPYVKHWRLQLAAKLLQDQTLSLSNIAEQVGTMVIRPSERNLTVHRRPAQAFRNEGV